MYFAYIDCIMEHSWKFSAQEAEAGYEASLIEEFNNGRKITEE